MAHFNPKYPSISRGMLRTLGNAVSNAASTVAGSVGRMVDVRPTYRQIGNFVVKGASYESFDSSGLFGSWGSSSGSSDSSGLFGGWGSSSGSSDSSGYFSSLSSGISGDSSGYFGGLQSMGQIGSGWWGASGGTDASDGSGGGVSGYLPSGKSTAIFFGISAVLALIPVALILNHMIFMPLVLRIFVAIFVYAMCVINPFLAIPIYLYYIVLMMIHWKTKSPYLLFPFFGFWPLRARQPTDSGLVNFFTWPFSYLDPDLSKERHVNQRIEYEAGAKLYAKSLVNTLRLPAESAQKLGIDGLRDKVIQGLMSVVEAQDKARAVVEEAKAAKAAAEAVAATGAAVAGTVAAAIPYATPVTGLSNKNVAALPVAKPVTTSVGTPVAIPYAQSVTGLSNKNVAALPTATPVAIPPSVPLAVATPVTKSEKPDSKPTEEAAPKTTNAVLQTRRGTQSVLSAAKKIQAEAPKSDTEVPIKAMSAPAEPQARAQVVALPPPPTALEQAQSRAKVVSPAIVSRLANLEHSRTVSLKPHDN